MLSERKECMNQFCFLCCGVSKEMIIDMANKYTTANTLGLTLTPGQNIIDKLITGDEKAICKIRCNLQYPTPQPKQLPFPPQI